MPPNFPAIAAAYSASEVDAVAVAAALEPVEVAALLPVVLALLLELIADELSVLDTTMLLLLLMPVVIVSEEETVPDSTVVSTVVVVPLIMEAVAVAIGAEGVATVSELLGSELADIDDIDIELVAVAVAKYAAQRA